MLKDKLVDFIKEIGCDYLIVNSTNEFLVEYNELEQNARYFLTGFSGSTGEALLNKEGQISLFVDGRYHTQADNEVFKNIEVVKLQLGETFLSALETKLIPNSKLAIVAGKTSLSFYKNLAKTLGEKNIDIIALDKDPVFEFTELKKFQDAPIVDIPLNISGISSAEKISTIQNQLSQNEVRIITNLEQIAWLLNKRSFAQNFSSCFKAKMIIEKDSYKVFNSNELSYYNNYLKDVDKIFIFSPKSLSYGDYLLIKNKSSALEKDEIELQKAIKNAAEIEHMKHCFAKTDIVVTKTSDYVNKSTSLTEQELVKFVEKEFFAQGATSLSFNTILASSKNSALAHYSTDMKTETPIQEGALILLDCGAYFEGGYATDITRVFCMGEPSPEAKKVYTTVLKANLNAYHIEPQKNLNGFKIDEIARNVIKSSNLDNYNFNHATGHGVGISVHEYPQSISPSQLAKEPLKDGMTFTIEPGAYNPSFGGVRLENTVYLQNGEIKSFSKVRFEEKLIDYSLLNEQEKIWLKEWQENALCL